MMKPVYDTITKELLGIIKIEKGRILYKGKKIPEYVKKHGLKNIMKNPFYDSGNAFGNAEQKTYNDQRAATITDALINR